MASHSGRGSGTGGGERIGVDLGGTKIAAVVMDAAGRVVRETRRPTPRSGYTAIVEAVAATVAELETGRGGPLPVGIGTPGSMSTRTGRMKNCNSVVLNDQPLHADLEAALDRSVRMANDADCFVLSEAVDGAAAGASPVFGVIIGTGVGGGIAVNGRLLQGPDRITGEWGHNPLPRMGDDESPGPPCWCGRRGCIETFLSGPGLSADHLRHAGEELGAEEVAARAGGGDAAAAASLTRYADRMARALAGVINILDPEVIVLGGGLSNIADLYCRVPARWDEHVFSDEVLTRLVPPAHGDASGVRGAARLCDQAEGERPRNDVK